MVGIGLGLQNLFSDFVSGIILLFDSKMRVGDIIETDGMICRVKSINLRTTTVMTRDFRELIVPNSILTKNELINWTHGDNTGRFEVSVGVAYNSDVDLVSRLLLQAAHENNLILQEPEPFVRLANFGESSLDFSLFFWTTEIFKVERIKSNLRFKIFRLFNENKVNIPYPQIVINDKRVIEE